MKTNTTITCFLLLTFLIPTIENAQSSVSNSDQDGQVRILLEKGVKLISEDNYTEALEFILQAINLQPDNAELYRLQGQIFEILDKKDSAKVSWEKCLNYADEKELKMEAQIHLNNLKD